MKRKFVQIAAFCLMLACLLTVVSAAYSSDDDEYGDYVEFEFPEGDGTGSGSEDDGFGYDDYEYYNPEEGEKTIRVGLYFGNGALDGANLANFIGRGYSFGYYNDSNEFIEVGYTDKSALSVVKTTNVYYGTYNGYTSYHDDITSNIAVGCYHLQLPWSYYSFEEAQWEADYYADYDSFVAYVDGSYYVRIGNYVNRDRAVSAMEDLSWDGVDTEVVGTSSYGVSVVESGSNTIIFQYDDNGNGTGLGVQAISENDEKTQTWFMGFKWYGGFRYERVNGGDLTVVNFVDMEDYANCVISREMSNSWPLEALKAQAVAARSYAASLSRSRHPSAYHFDLCNTTCCQAYHGTSLTGENTARAVAETAGQYVWYNGQIARAFYSASNGGASEDVSVIWGSNQATYPYLAGVVDPYEATVVIGNYAWTREFAPSVLKEKMRAKGYNCSNIVNAYVGEYSRVGNPKTVVLVDSDGRSYTMKTGKFVSMLGGLPSYRYDFGTGAQDEYSVNGTDSVIGVNGLYAVNGNGEVVAINEGAYVITDQGVSKLVQDKDDVVNSKGNIVISGKGKGHNVGMSQHGARAMALQGYDYEEILKFYYTGVTVG